MASKNKQVTVAEVKKTAKVARPAKQKTVAPSLERERVFYEALKKGSSTSIKATFKDRSHIITPAQVNQLSTMLGDDEGSWNSFYSYLNNEVGLLRALEADSQAKKLGKCINTQYDSRKKLRAYMIQLGLSAASQRVKRAKKIAAVATK